MRDILFWMHAYAGVCALDSISGIPAIQMAFTIYMCYEEVASNIESEDGAAYDEFQARRLDQNTKVEWERKV